MAETNAITTQQMKKVREVDFVTQFSHNSLAKLLEVLGVTRKIPMMEGTTMYVYSVKGTLQSGNVAEGEIIPLTKVERKLARTIELGLNTYRRNTTHKAIQASGRDVAINKTDEKLLSGIQKDIKKNFYDVLLAGTGKAAGVGFQGTLAASWAELRKFHEDEDVTPIYFVSVDDVAGYIGGTAADMAQAFGLSYLENFLGLGTVIVSPRITKGKVVAVAKENLHGAYVPANSGDVARSFGLTADSTGLVGITHSIKTENATIDTLAMSGTVFYPEMLDGVIVGTIGDATGA
jgi:hypothetical protein